MCCAMLIGYILRWLVDYDLVRSVAFGCAVQRFDSFLSTAVLHELDESDGRSAGSRVLAEASVVQGSKFCEFGLELLLGHLWADTRYEDVFMCTGNSCTSDA